MLWRRAAARALCAPRSTSFLSTEKEQMAAAREAECRSPQQGGNRQTPLAQPPTTHQERGVHKNSGTLASVAEAIGSTPLVDLSRLVKNTPNTEGRILAKLDYLNPGFSKKDRIALQMVLEAERSGDLKPGQPVIELTSGNTGTGLAIVCAVTGHPCILLMSEGNSMERARMMRALGAEVILVPQKEGSVPGQVSGEDLDLVFQRTEEVVGERGAYRADQFEL